MSAASRTNREDVSAAATFLDFLDLAVFLLPIILLSLEFSNRPWQRIGKIIYLTSVLLMYGALLFAVRNGWHRWIIALTPANAAFHAVEYMGIVTFYARRRESHGSASLFQTMARSWSLVLVIYAICLGIFSEFADRTTQGIWSDQAITLKDLWFGVNLWAAFLHYAYDGMIWKLRRPETAKVLGVELHERNDLSRQTAS